MTTALAYFACAIVTCMFVMIVTDVTIRYFSTDDARNNPAAQLLGVSDLSWVFAIPEPGTGLLLGLGLVMLGVTRRRNARR